jgi:ABC-type nitrate/sulfonate/bicarbonate transport system ATPase subunit
VNSASGSPCVTLQGVSKSFRGSRGEQVEVLQDINFSAADGEFVSVIGPSGCGKSTLFALIAALSAPDGGTIEVHGVPLTSAPPSVAFMPQKDLLFPWRSVRRNVVLPLQIQGVKKEEARRRADELFPTFGLSGFENAYPFTLSGGMRQRAALLRTIIQDRPLLLLDEPFGALDSLTRSEMQEFLLDVWSRFKRTILFITHDVREAVYLSDRIYVMSARPARVRVVFDVHLPRPRNIDMIATTEFAEIETRLLHTLREEAKTMHVHELEQLRRDV